MKRSRRSVTRAGSGLAAVAPVPGDKPRIDWVKVLALLVSLCSLTVAIVSLTIGQVRAEPKLQVSGTAWLSYDSIRPGKGLVPDNPPGFRYVLAVLSNVGTTNVNVSNLVPVDLLHKSAFDYINGLTLDNCEGVGPKVLGPGDSLPVLYLVHGSKLPRTFFEMGVSSDATFLQAPTDKYDNFDSVNAYLGSASKTVHKCLQGVTIAYDDKKGYFEMSDRLPASTE